MPIIAFMGEKKSGKDYFTQYCVDAFGFKRLSFSDEVRRLAQKIYPWLPFDVPAETKDDPFYHKMNPNNLSFRQILLTVGKVRDVDPGYFVNQFIVNQYSKINHSDENFIITDFRTYDEHLFLKQYDIPILKIVREDRSGIKEDSFEDYVREYDKHDGLFLNKMDGVVRFHTYFKLFCEEFDIKLLED